MTRFVLAACLLALALAPAGAGQPQQQDADASGSQGGPRAPYVTTPHEVVEEMLKVAKVAKSDVVYDLGSGDGRIVIAAARRYGARGVGIDIDPALVREARDNARRAGVADRVKFVEQDLFEADIREATVVTLFLMSSVNLRLRPKLLSELKPGTRVVSHAYDMGDWKPERVVEVDRRGAWGKVYFWVIPAGAKD